MTHSRNKLESSSEAAWSTGRLRATMPPNAETGSHARARANASATVDPSATPHGVLCLMITQAGSSYSFTAERRLEIDEVVVAELLALEDLRERDRRLVRLAAGAVEGAALVRVLAVAEVPDLRVDGGERPR